MSTADPGLSPGPFALTDPRNPCFIADTCVNDPLCVQLCETNATDTLLAHLLAEVAEMRQEQRELRAWLESLPERLPELLEPAMNAAIESLPAPVKAMLGLGLKRK